MYVRKGLHITTSRHNEYCMWAQVSLPNSTRVNVVNVYLPPASSLTRRGVGEDEARDAIAHMLTNLPPQQPSFVCGDLNTRIGNMSPSFDDTCLGRISQDTRVCPRAGWLLDICDQHHLHVLNGHLPQPPAPPTHRGPWGASIVDYILSTEGTLTLEYNHRGTLGLSDHTLLLTTLPTTCLHDPASSPTPTRTVYKWVQGETTSEYPRGGAKWATYTSEPDFLREFSHLVHLHETTAPSPSADPDGALRANTLRAQQVERFLLDHALKAGVVTKTELSVAKNPNKWDKTLAPWFDDHCREQRQLYIDTRRRHGKSAPATKSAWAAYRQACAAGKSSFQGSLPDMLKYKPK